MPSKSTSKIGSAAVFIFTAACFLTAAYFGIVNYDAYLERREYIEKTEALRLKASKIKSDNDYKKEYFGRLANDGEFAARVVRETLGYVGENEIIFKFDKDEFSARSKKGVSVERISNKSK